VLSSQVELKLHGYCEIDVKTVIIYLLTITCQYRTVRRRTIKTQTSGKPLSLRAGTD